jgi:hypothetical protein
VNHVTAEDAQQALDVVFGMFLANSNPTTVLFDSRATHSFISSRFVGIHNLPIATMKHTMLVSSPRGEMKTRQLCPTVSVTIRGGRLLVSSDRSWFTRNWHNHRHGLVEKAYGVIHCAKRTVQLVGENGTKVEFVAAPSTRMAVSLNAMKAIPMDEIR